MVDVLLDIGNATQAAGLGPGDDVAWKLAWSARLSPAYKFIHSEYVIENENPLKLSSWGDLPIQKFPLGVELSRDESTGPLMFIELGQDSIDSVRGKIVDVQLVSFDFGYTDEARGWSTPGPLPNTARYSVLRSIPDSLPAPDPVSNRASVEYEMHYALITLQCDTSLAP